MDGGALGELEYEIFNAAGATVHTYGRNVHSGSAKGKMKNALLIAQELQSLLPVQQNPMYTEGVRGIFPFGPIERCGGRSRGEEVRVIYGNPLPSFSTSVKINNMWEVKERNYV